MIRVEGPKNLKIGDLVEFKVGNAHREGTRRGEVTRIGDDSATLRSEGKSRVVKFFRIRQGSDWRRTAYQDYLMQKVEPLDLWRERKPVTPYITAASGVMNPSCTIDHRAIQNDTEKVIDELLAIAAWLKEKP